MINEIENERQEQTDLQNEIERLKQEVARYQQQEIVDAALWRARARNPIAVRALIDWTEATTEQLDQAIGIIREQEPYLFYLENTDQPKLTGFSPIQGADNQQDAFISGFLNR